MGVSPNDLTGSDGIRVEVDGPVVTLTFDRPSRKNAITEDMWRQLHRLSAAIARCDDVRAVVVTGAGEAFCSGADLDPAAADQAPRHWARRMDEINDACLALHRLPQPTVARVNGVAAGAGMNLALGCDLVVAAESARFCEIFSRRGLSVDFGGSWVLPRLVGLHRAKELVLLSEMLTAERAAEMGLVNKVVSDEQLDAAVGAWVEILAAGPPVAMAASKRLLDHGIDSTLEVALAAEGSAQAVNFATKDTVEAFLAFLQRREPRFTGH